MNKIGIVGSGEDKFTTHTRLTARMLIDILIKESIPCVVCSGRSPLGGVDKWAEEQAEVNYQPTNIFPAKFNNWKQGYRPRNIQIAEFSDIIHVVLVSHYPDYYEGRRFKSCYHCNSNNHVKSGGCWTAMKARSFGKPAIRHIIQDDEHTVEHSSY